jgi:hypothetical protein
VTRKEKRNERCRGRKMRIGDTKEDSKAQPFYTHAFGSTMLWFCGEKRTERNVQTNKGIKVITLRIAPLL